MRWMQGTGHLGPVIAGLMFLPALAGLVMGVVVDGGAYRCLVGQSTVTAVIAAFFDSLLVYFKVQDGIDVDEV